jgi:hypothetical protein
MTGNIAMTIQYLRREASDWEDRKTRGEGFTKADIAALRKRADRLEKAWKRLHEDIGEANSFVREVLKRP